MFHKLINKKPNWVFSLQTEMYTYIFWAYFHKTVQKQYLKNLFLQLCSKNFFQAHQYKDMQWNFFFSFFVVFKGRVPNRFLTTWYRFFFQTKLCSQTPKVFWILFLDPQSAFNKEMISLLKQQSLKAKLLTVTSVSFQFVKI